MVCIFKLILHAKAITIYIYYVCLLQYVSLFLTLYNRVLFVAFFLYRTKNIININQKTGLIYSLKLECFSFIILCLPLLLKIIQTVVRRSCSVTYDGTLFGSHLQDAELRSSIWTYSRGVQ